MKKSYLSSAPFGRLLTAMVTPFNNYGAVDYQLAARLADYLVNEGSDGVIVSGTTGESPTLSWDEQHKLFKVVQESVGSRAKVLVGTGSNSTAEAVEATIEAAKNGADGALVVVPYYNKPPQEGLENYFASIASAAPDLPLMLYNIPSRTGTSLTPITVKNLMQFSNIVGFKAASGNTQEVTQLRVECGSRLSIYSGDDGLLLPMLAVGAVGVVSVASHLVGKQLKLMIESYLRGDTLTSLEYHESLQPLFQALFATTNPIPVKAALEIRGWQVGPPRSPLIPLDKEMTIQLKSILDSL
tara:strand:- start:13843 stop:14739 length:897 start_codon:yes stop_codon:yes gene_type:complete